MSDKARWVSACCEGETCWCGAPAERKVEEEPFYDDPTAWTTAFGTGRTLARHPLSAYVCFEHFAQMMGPAAKLRDAQASGMAYVEEPSSEAPTPGCERSEQPPAEPLDHLSGEGSRESGE